MHLGEDLPNSQTQKKGRKQKIVLKKDSIVSSLLDWQDAE